MTRRTFTDVDGARWEVRPVSPHTSAPHVRYEGLDAATPAGAGLPAAGGWLSFQCATGECRRLTPIPDGWEHAPEAALVAHCAAAVRVSSPADPSRPER